MNKPKPLRQEFQLTEQELRSFELFCCRRFEAGYAPIWEFWKQTASTRGLDYKTLLAHPVRRGTFSGLPLGHKQHWCWPMPLKCEYMPPKDLTVEIPKEIKQ